MTNTVEYNEILDIILSIGLVETIYVGLVDLQDNRSLEIPIKIPHVRYVLLGDIPLN